MYVFFSHESKYDLQLSDLHENCAHRVFLTDSEVFCLSHENILGHKTHGMTCTWSSGPQEQVELNPPKIHSSLEGKLTVLSTGIVERNYV